MDVKFNGVLLFTAQELSSIQTRAETLVAMDGTHPAWKRVYSGLALAIKAVNALKMKCQALMPGDPIDHGLEYRAAIKKMLDREIKKRSRTK